MKRPGECLFCTSRRCYTRIHTSLARVGGPLYDEVCCLDHIKALELDADERAPDTIKTHISSSGTLRRSPPLDDQVRRLVAIGEAVQTLGAQISEDGDGWNLRRGGESTWKVVRVKSKSIESWGLVGLDEAMVDAAQAIESS